MLERAAPVNERGELNPQIVRLSAQASAAWVDFHNAVEAELASGGELYDVRDVASKSADNAARLAALFQAFDQGFGELISLAVERGRATRPDIKLGICGEHGGDPKSIAFCETTGLDYVSASPYRVPIARLAAAQAALQR